MHTLQAVMDIGSKLLCGIRVRQESPYFAISNRLHGCNSSGASSHLPEMHCPELTHNKSISA
jgi:hypothetical protein